MGIVSFSLLFILGTQTLIEDWHLVDLLALKELSESFTNGSVLLSWSNDSKCYNWDGVVCVKDAENMSNGVKVSLLSLSAKV